MGYKISEIQRKYLSGELKVEDFVKSNFDKIRKNDLGSYISLDEENALEKARLIDKKIANKEDLGSLFGVTFAIKDNISTKDLKTTCASKMLENYIPIFDASVIERLKAQDAIILGKANMDEFAMGSSSETSYFGPTKNPIDKSLIPGGSSSGSAAAVAGDEAIVSLGSDTGGSVRQPAAYCNIVGYYPSYGLISRYGVVAMGNTFDQVGLLANSVEDIVKVVNVVGGYDEKDPNSHESQVDYKLVDYSFKDKKIAVVKDIESFNIDQVVLDDYHRALEDLKILGAEIQEVEIDHLKYANMIYTVLMSAEVSSNMSRFDGIRFGYHDSNYSSTQEMYIASRSGGFGDEVKRRIALGTLLLSSNNDQIRYKRGLKGRKLLRDEMERVLRDFDFFISPTSTKLPHKLGERKNDPLSVYDSGTFNVLANISSLPAISLPIRNGISGSLQIISKRFEDESLLNAAYAFERRPR